MKLLQNFYIVIKKTMKMYTFMEEIFNKYINQSLDKLFIFLDQELKNKLIKILK